MRRQVERGAIYGALACVALGSICAGLASAGSGVRRPRVRAVIATGAGSPGAAVTAAFGVFSSVPADEEDLPVVRSLVAGITEAPPLQAGSLRRAQTVKDIRILVAGTAGQICLFDRIPGQADGGACAPVQNAATPATPLMSTRAYPPSDAETATGQRSGDALFPDGTTNVTLISPRGAVRSLTLVNNTVAFVGGPDETLSWTGPDGHRYGSRIIN